MTNTVTIDRRTRMPLGLVISIIGGVVALTMAAMGLYYDVAALKLDMTQVKTEVHELHDRVYPCKPGVALSDEPQF